MKKLKSSAKKPTQQNEQEWTTVPVDGANGKGPMPPDDSDLQRRIAKNPSAVAAEAKYKLHELQAGYRHELYAVLAMIYGIARHFSMDYPAWKAFFSQPFFQGGKIKPKARKHQEQALRHTLNFVFDAKSKQKRNRTGKYAAAMRQYMLIGMPAHIVAAEIEKDGGIEALYEAYLENEAKKPKRGRNKPRTDEQYESMSECFNLDDDNVAAPEDIVFDDLDDGSKPRGEPDDASNLDDGEDGLDTDDELDLYRDIEKTLDPPIARGRDPEGRPTIEFETGEARQARFLELQKGRQAIVLVTSLGRTSEGWQRIKVDKVTWKSRRNSQ